jgi:HK97 family phage major capsid protein
MEPIKVLRQTYADLIVEANAIFDLATNEKRLLSDKEKTRDDEITDELERVKADMQRAEAHMARQRQMPAVIGGLETGGERAAAPKAGKDLAKFSNLGDMLMAVRQAGEPHGYIDPRLSAGPTGMNESVGTEGGFLVQQDFIGQLMTNVYEMGQISSRIRRIPVGPNSNGIKAWGLDETSRVNGSRWGGVQSFWTGEAALKTASMPKFKRLSMELDKLTGLCYVTDELLQDSVALESIITQAFRDEFTFKIEDSIVNGTGSGQPLGILNSGAVVSVAKTASQPIGINGANIMAMWTRLNPRSRQTAVWLINPDAETTLWQLYNPVTNVAGTENVGGIALPTGLFTAPGAPGGGTGGSLLGRPVIPCEYCATLGTVGDIILFDPDQYLAIDKGPMQTASSIHVRFIYDESVYRFVYRYNGMPLQYSAMTPYKGSVTTSPYITLATRP